VPKEISLEDWKSFSIVSFNVNYFGIYKLENVWNLVEKLVEDYYRKYLSKKLWMNEDKWAADNGFRGEWSTWWRSSMLKKLRVEIKYRGWIGKEIYY
jgi:hypothetical protein